MKRLLAVAAGGLGVAGFLRRRRRRVDATDDRAAELRAKLAESKQIVDERDAEEAVETTVDEAIPAPQDRRAEVHQRARQALDELQ